MTERAPNWATRSSSSTAPGPNRVHHHRLGVNDIFECDLDPGLLRPADLSQPAAHPQHAPPARRARRPDRRHELLQPRRRGLVPDPSGRRVGRQQIVVFNNSWSRCMPDGHAGGRRRSAFAVTDFTTRPNSKASAPFPSASTTCAPSPGSAQVHRSAPTSTPTRTATASIAPKRSRRNSTLTSRSEPMHWFERVGAA